MIIPATYHPGHAMGESERVAVDPEVCGIEALVYVNIPKNASCWVKYHLSQCQSEFYNYYHQGFDVTRNLALIVLRDPVERWISGMSQILIGYNNPNHSMHVDRLDWQKVTSELVRDTHTQPQHEFFANIPHDRIVWFRCDGQLKETFPNFLKKYNLGIRWLSEDQDVDNQFNMTKKIQKQIVNNYSRPPQQQIVDKIQAVLKQHPEYVERIKNLYLEDYKLFNTVPYYKK
jgi:hypothetical protein